jgi:hypothetical protein
MASPRNFEDETHPRKAAGAVRGIRQQKLEQEAAGEQATQQTDQAQQQSEAAARAQYQGKQDIFKSAFSACMDAHG